METTLLRASLHGQYNCVFQLVQSSYSRTEVCKPCLLKPGWGTCDTSQQCSGILMGDQTWRGIRYAQKCFTPLNKNVSFNGLVTSKYQMYSQTCFSPKLNVLRNIFIILIHYTKALFMCVQNNHLSKFFVAHNQFKENYAFFLVNTIGKYHFKECFFQYWNGSQGSHLLDECLPLNCIPREDSELFCFLFLRQGLTIQPKFASNS